MTKPIEKQVAPTLVHHPSDVLDLFGQYDATNRNWIEFDDSLTEQIVVLEANNEQYIKLRPLVNRRSSR